MAFHPKNPVVATVSDDETWKLWSILDCEVIMSGEGHTSWIAAVEFHPPGTHMATASGDTTVKVWDFATATCSATLSDHAHPVWDTSFHHAGDFLVSASMDHTAKCWGFTYWKMSTDIPWSCRLGECSGLPALQQSSLYSIW